MFKALLGLLLLFPLFGVLQAQASGQDQVLIQVKNFGSVERPVFRMKVYVNNRAKYNFKVSTGNSDPSTRSEATPEGKFNPYILKEWHESSQSNSSWLYDGDPMPHSIFFYKGFAIHGSKGQVNGLPVSHGCIRMWPADASKLFKLVTEAVTLPNGQLDFSRVVIDIRGTENPALFR